MGDAVFPATQPMDSAAATQQAKNDPLPEEYLIPMTPQNSHQFLFKYKRGPRQTAATSRIYPGYEDYSPQGRAQAAAFEAAGGIDLPPKEYMDAVNKALEARKAVDASLKAFDAQATKTQTSIPPDIAMLAQKLAQGLK